MILSNGLPELSSMLSVDGMKGLAAYALFVSQPGNIMAVANEIIHPSPFFQAIARDYIRQGTTKRIIPPTATVTKPFDPEQLRFLHEIVGFCRSREINCVYAFGPIRDTFCRNSGDFIARERALIEEAGMRVAPDTPFCTSVEEQGDVEDHVSPQLKTEFTRRYAKVLAENLDR